MSYINSAVENYRIETAPAQIVHTSYAGSCRGCKYDPSYEQQRGGILCLAEGDCDGVSHFAGRDTTALKSNAKYRSKVKEERYI